LDIAALDSFDEGVVMLNLQGAFDPDSDFFSTGGEEGTAVEIAPGDFDGDGEADLVVLNREDRTLSLLLGDGDGFFAEPQILSTLNDALEPDQLPSDLAVADLDDDGSDDVAVINSGFINDLQMLVRYGPNLMQTVPYVGPFEATSIELADLDGNGFRDALVSSAGGPIALLPDDGGVGFTDFGAFSISGTDRGIAIAVGDFAGDSLPDFVQLRVEAFGFQVAVNVSNQPSPTVTATPPPEPTVTETAMPPSTPTTTPPSSVTATPTAIPTETPAATGTATVEASPSPTMATTPTRVPFDEDDGCAMVVRGSGQSTSNGSAMLLLVGLALSWRRQGFRSQSHQIVSRKAVAAAAALFAARR
jgi:hypothetical protein